MQKHTILSVLVAGMLLLGGAAFAWQGEGKVMDGDGFRGCRGKGVNQEQQQERRAERLDKMAIMLDLTAEQKQQVETLFAAQGEKRQELQVKMKASQEELHMYRDAKEYDEATFRAKAQNHADLKVEMMVQHASSKQQLLEILTPKQQEKAEVLKEMRGERKHGMRNDNGGCDRDCDADEPRGPRGKGKRCNK